MSHGRFDNPVVAALAGFFDLFRGQARASRLTDKDRFDGKTVLVSGANSGLGYALAVECARRGGAVIMACRREIPQAGERARRESGSDDIVMRALDLSSVSSLRDFCDGLAAAGVTLDVVFLNAATTLPEARQTESGLDEMFLVNYLANFMLVHRLLSADVFASGAPHIVFISSDSHQGASAVDYDEFGRFRPYGVSKAINNYSYFKLLLNTFAVELSRRLERAGSDIRVNVICPGPVNSNIIKEAPWLLRIVLRAIFTIIFRSPKQAARAPVYMAISNDYADKRGEYLHMFNPKAMDPKVYDPDEGARLWAASIELWHRIDPACPELRL